MHAEVAYLAHQGDGQPPPSPGGVAIREDCSAFFAISPVGTGAPSSPQMCRMPSRARPTDPGRRSHSGLVTNVVPMASVAA